MKSNHTIITLENLQEAVNRDKQDHVTKELAILLLAAMRDWPTNSDRIEHFVQQFKAFHTVNRRPLDLDRVKSNTFAMAREHDLWRHEANAYIKQMMERAVAAYGLSDLDGIVDHIVGYYQDPDIKKS